MGAYSLKVETITDSTSTGDAVEVGVGTETRGVLEDRQDSDYFKVELTEETELIVRSTSAVPNTTGQVLDEHENLVATNSRGHLEGGLRQFLIREVLEAGVYYITVETYLTLDTIRLGLVHEGPYTLHVQTVDEPGSSVTDAARLTFDRLGAGNIGTSSDVGFFRLDIATPVHVVLALVGDEVTVDAEILDSRGRPSRKHVYRDIRPDTGTLYKSIVRTRLGRGTYFLSVEASDSPGENLGGYVVQMIEDRHYVELADLCGEHSMSPSDPLYGCQWNLKNTGRFGGVAGEDINVEGVWASGHRGAGVNVVVIDRPIDSRHEDLVANLDAARSHDYTAYDFTASLGHGTGVAGIIAARDNNLGIRGVAPRARVFGYNLLDDFTTDNLTQAMSAHVDVTQVSNNSWGHPDSSALRTAPSIWEVAVETGLREGAGGRGVFYTWAAGNGALVDDNANYGEYTNYYGVTAVCAVNNQGVRSLYSESGANLWICAPSNDQRQGRPGIVTSIDYNTYRRSFGGTSAAAPTVSGVVALLRGSDRRLTWRDVKLILAGSARQNDPGNTGWETGAAKYGSAGENYSFNHEYGFGVVDAGAAMDLARGWTSLPPLAKQSVNSTGGSVAVPDSQTTVNSSLTVASDVDGATCEYRNGAFQTVTSGHVPPASVDFVEFVEVNTDFEAPAFRDLTVKLVSPSGAVSTLAVPKPEGERVGLEEVFRFGSARHLGEDPAGTWTLEISDDRSGGTAGTLNGWCLTIYGHRLRPGPPSVTLIPGDGRLTVNWQPPANTGASEVTGYELRYIETSAADRSDQNWTHVRNLGRRTSMRSVTGLTNHTQYDMEVRAINSHGQGPWHTVTAAPVVNTDPYFPQRTADRFVVENPTPTTRIGEPVAAVDTDGDRLTYTLTAGSGLFEIGEHSGQITVVDGTTLDHETTTTLSLRVTVSDLKDVDGNDDTVVDDSIPLTLEVTNRNEAPEVRGPDQITYPEDRTTKTLGTFTASDPDTYATISWSLSGTDHDDFTIADGVLGFRTFPDYENPTDSNRDNEYLVSVQASDGNHTVTKPVRVSVTNREEFGSVSLSALQPQVGTPLVANLVDPDGKVADRRWTWWSSPNLSAPWESIDNTTESSYTPLPQDVDRYLQARVSYKDGHGSQPPPAFATSDYQVRGEPATNQVPRFLSLEAVTRNVEENVEENVRAPTAIGGPVSATDDDGDPLLYTLEGPDAGHFELDRHTGLLRTRAHLDYETRRGYRLRVKATDPSGVPAHQTVTIVVGNVDEAGTATLSTTRPQVDTPIAASLDHDPDGNVSDVSWTWQRSTFQVLWADITDADTSSYTPTDDDRLHHLRAVASYTDGQGPGKTATTAHSELVQPTPPLRITVDSTQIREGDSTTLTLTTDGRVFQRDQTATLIFIGTAAEGDDYTANPTTMTIAAGDTTSTAVIHAIADSLTEAAETIIIHLLHQNQIIGTATVTIRSRGETGRPTPRPQPPSSSRPGGSGPGSGGGGPVGLPAGSNQPPEFSEGSRTVRSVTENSEAGVGIGGPLVALDPEGDVLVYTLSGPDADIFGLVASSGQLQTKALVDYESKNSYTVTVGVRDSRNVEGDPDRSRDDSIRVTIIVTDQDEAGTVTLSAPTPRAGTPLGAALEDPDGGISGLSWRWERSQDGAAWTPVDAAGAVSYTPAVEDEGYHLRVVVSYTDTHSESQTATGVSQAPATVGVVTEFPDVEAGGVHTPAIEALAEAGIFTDTECGPQRFCPHEPIPRWVMAVWLIRMLGDDPPAKAVSRFADIPTGLWWIRYTERLADRRVTIGCATNPPRYCPDQPVTRAQMATFLIRALQLAPAQTPAGFQDTQNSVHATNIDTLAAAGITQGCATGPLRYCPDQPVTRAQMATFLHRANRQ